MQSSPISCCHCNEGTDEKMLLHQNTASINLMVERGYRGIQTANISLWGKAICISVPSSILTPSELFCSNADVSLLRIKQNARPSMEGDVQLISLKSFMRKTSLGLAGLTRSIGHFTPILPQVYNTKNRWKIE